MPNVEAQGRRRIVTLGTIWLASIFGGAAILDWLEENYGPETANDAAKQNQKFSDIILPSGYNLTSFQEGVGVLQKEGKELTKKTVVTIIDLSRGARLVPIFKIGRGGPQNPNFKKLYLHQAIEAVSEQALYIGSGSFYGQEGYNSKQLNYPFKYQGEMISQGWANPNSNYSGMWRMLAIEDSGFARMLTVPDVSGNPKAFVDNILLDPKYPTVITGNTPFAPREAEECRGRTFLGLGKKGKHLISMSGFGTLAEISEDMCEFGISEEMQMQLDGSGSFNCAFRRNNDLEIYYAGINPIPMHLAAYPA